MHFAAARSSEVRIKLCTVETYRSPTAQSYSDIEALHAEGRVSLRALPALEMDVGWLLST
jgi:hypothetical protein